MPNQDLNKKGKKDRKRFDSKTSETVLPKSAETETSGSPQLTVLQLRPKSNYAEWVENNENYFSHTYGKHGEFFETMERYRPPVPKRPTVRAARPVEAVAAVASSSSASGPARNTRSRPAPSTQPQEERKAAEPSDSEDDSSSDESSSDEESVYSVDKVDADMVESEEAAIYIYNKRLENMVKDEMHYERIRPQMYADLLRSLGSEAKATVRTSSRFNQAQHDKDEVLLRKICHKKLRQYSTARGVTKEIKSAKSLYQIHQFNSEHTSDYYERFKREVDAYETYMGEILPEHRKAAIFTEGLNNARYGTMKIEIENGITKRKRTLDKAYKQAMKRVLAATADDRRTTGILASNFSATKNDAKRGKQSSNYTNKRETKFEDKSKEKHYKSGGAAKRGNKFPCTTCKLLGEENFDHRAHECPNEAKALAIVKEASMYVDLDVDENMSAPTRSNRMRDHTYHVYEAEAAYSGMASLLQPDEIVFDPGSTINLFHNSDLLDGDVREVNLGGISTYGGTATAQLVGEYKGMETYVNPEGPANLLAQVRLKKIGAQIDYDDSGNGEYTVTFRDGSVMVFQSRDDLSGLYVYTPLKIHVHVTVKERLKLFTKREQRKAIEARMKLPNLGFPSDKDYAAFLKGHTVRNMHVTAADVYRAHRIFGKDIPSYMGKRTRQTPPKIDLEKVDAVIDKRIWLGMDVFIVNSGAYMLSVSSFRYKLVTYMGILNKTMHNDADTFWFHIRHHVNSYRARGFQISELETDDENAFLANKANIEGLGVKYDPTYGSKVEECERAVRAIKERHRAFAFYLPFPLTHVMEKYLVLNCARLLNVFPTQGNGYEGIPPTEIYRGTKLDWKIDFPVAFGDVCLVPSDIGDNESKTAKARGEIAIAMLPHGNASGDVTFLNTRTMHKIVRNQFTIIPTPQFVISYLKQHVGNRFAASRRNPIYRSLRGEVVDDSADAAPAEIERYGEPADQVIPIHRETLDQLEDEPDDADSPANEPNVQLESAAEPAIPSEQIFQPTDGAATESADEELQLDADPDAPTVDIEDIRRRYPIRSNRSTWRERSYFAVSASFNANKLLNLEPRHRLKAMVKEIYGIAVLKQGLVPVNPSTLTYKQLKGVISSKLFTKAKYSPDGEFEKWKARLVAGGHMQKREEYTYSETSSPTVGVTSILTVAALAAKERRKTATADFTAAYLNADMKDDRQILMRLSRENSAILCMLVPEYKAYLREDGTMIVRLTKALYGCIESAKLWYESISKTLIADGYARNTKDDCVFNKNVDGKQITVCLYVDDLFLTCENEEVIHQTINMLKKRYKDLTCSVSNKLKYVGMVFDFSVTGECHVSMPNFLASVVEEAGVTTVAPTPAANDLFATAASDEPLCPEKSDLFHSLVMKLQYLAKRVRPDILLPVVFLSSRVTKSTMRDWNKLMRIIRYLNGSKDLYLKLKPNNGLLSIYVFVDASFAVHHDFKSHTGAVVTLGAGCIFFKSTKQKLNTKSSTEAELVAVSDVLSTIIWLREFLIEQGYQVGAAMLYQDNMSTIAMIENGRGSNERSRHINIKFFFVSDRVQKGELAIKYMPTNDMIADMLTKPLQGEKFRVMRDTILGHTTASDTN